MTPQPATDQIVSSSDKSENDSSGIGGTSSSKLLEKEKKGNGRLTVLVLILVLLVVTLGVSLLVYIMQGSSSSQNTQNTDIADARDYLSSHGDEPAAYERLALAEMRGGDEQGALEVIADGIAQTGDAALNATLGDMLREAGDHTQAISAYNKAELDRLKELGVQSGEDLSASSGGGATFHDQYLSRVYYGRALSELATDDQAAARKDLENSAALSPESATVWTALGNLYVEMNEMDLATAAYENALKYVPDYQEAIVGLEQARGGN